MKDLFSVRTPAQFSGPLSECLARAHPANPREFERRWLTKHRSSVLAGPGLAEVLRQLDQIRRSMEAIADALAKHLESDSAGLKAHLRTIKKLRAAAGMVKDNQ